MKATFEKKVHFPQKIKLVKIHDIAFSTRARKVVLWYFFKREIREENLQFNFRSTYRRYFFLQMR